MGLRPLVAVLIALAASVSLAAPAVAASGAWVDQSLGNTDVVRGLWALNQANAWAVGATADGTPATSYHWSGTAPWSAVDPTSTNALRDVSIVDASHVWAVGDGGTIRFWNGTSWSSQTSGTSQVLRGVYFVDNSHGWAVGDAGAILFWNGTSWSAQTSGTSNRLWDVYFNPDGVHGWAVGVTGTILFTFDGGQNWNPQTSGTTQILRGVTFVDLTHGWIVGGPSGSPTISSIILNTSDGGTGISGGWQAQAPNTVNALYAVSFVDLNHGWAVGINGTVNVWDGSVWTPTSISTNPLLDVDFMDTCHTSNTAYVAGWAVGANGTIEAFQCPAAPAPSPSPSPTPGLPGTGAKPAGSAPTPWSGLGLLLSLAALTAVALGTFRRNLKT